MVIASTSKMVGGITYILLRWPLSVIRLRVIMAETIIFYEQGAYNLGKAFVFEKSSAFFLESNFLRISKK